MLIRPERRSTVTCEPGGAVQVLLRSEAVLLAWDPCALGEGVTVVCWAHADTDALNSAMANGERSVWLKD